MDNRSEPPVLRVSPCTAGNCQPRGRILAEPAWLIGWRIRSVELTVCVATAILDGSAGQVNGNGEAGPTSQGRFGRLALARYRRQGTCRFE